MEARHGICKFGALIKTHADDDDKAAINNPDIAHVTVTEKANVFWGEIGRTAVSDHRNGKCSCSRGDA
jgi:hypothetical protein